MSDDGKERKCVSKGNPKERETTDAMSFNDCSVEEEHKLFRRGFQAIVDIKDYSEDIPLAKEKDMRLHYNSLSFLISASFYLK